MKDEEIDLIICIEGGLVTHFATPRDGMCIRVIDYDNAKIGNTFVLGYECDATLIDVATQTKGLIKEAKNDSE